MDNLDQETLDLAKALIARPSVSPRDEGCQVLMAEILSGLGFTIEWMPFGDVTNVWATHGTGGPILAFAGHTDVVPPGPLTEWHTPPFEPVIKGDMLFGRGAADMKGSLAAMLTATKRFLAAHPHHDGTLAFLITSDEEAEATHGTRKVMEALEKRGTKIDWCVVGEPSSSKELGDVIRVGRRGSLNAALTVKGIQGHIAYPAEAKNPIHMAMPALAELVAKTWDKGNSRFPPTSMQISNIHGGTGANNVIPGSLELLFNFRFSTESTADGLKHGTEEILQAHGLDYDIKWSLSGNPFLTTGNQLIDAAKLSLQAIEGITPELSTSGGTSDGRFIAPTGTEVIELGPCNATIHKINECVSISHLIGLSKVFTSIMSELLVDTEHND